jgi:hypothetical protein
MKLSDHILGAISLAALVCGIYFMVVGHSAYRAFKACESAISDEAFAASRRMTRAHGRALCSFGAMVVIAFVGKAATPDEEDEQE